MKNTTLIKTTTITISFLLLNSCSSTVTAEVKPDVTNSTIGTGYYVDSAVSGINYTCGTQKGITDSNGTFKFEKGQDCTFSIGGVKLRTTKASLLENNITVFENNTSVAKLLQTLDRDGNASNGIDINTVSAEKALKTSSIDTAKLDDALLQNLEQDLKAEDEGYTGKAKTTAETETHIQNTTKSITDNNIKTDKDKEIENQKIEKDNQSNSKGNDQGSNQGNSQGNSQGNDQGSNQGNSQGNSQGSTQGSNQGNSQTTRM